MSVSVGERVKNENRIFHLQTSAYPSNLAIASTQRSYLAHERQTVYVCVLSQRESWRERERERETYEIDFIVHDTHTHAMSSSLTKRIFLSREASLTFWNRILCQILCVNVSF